MKKPLKSFWRRPHAPQQTARALFWHRRVTGARHVTHHEDSGPHEAPRQPKPLERAWLWLHTTFPERQIYIRSDGRVQFFTFGPSLQATLAGLALIFLGWVAFATVNVVFKDRIIIAKDHRFQEMQAAYENRLADLQISYDELNGALVSAEDKFKSTADDLQTKQNTIASFLNRKAQVEASALPAPGAPVTLNSPATASMDTGPASDSLEVPAPAGSNFGADTDSGSTLAVMPGPVAPQPRTAKPAHASLLQD